MIVNRSGLFGATGLCALAVIACNWGDEANRTLEAQPTVDGDRNLVLPRSVILEGCLTASGDRFVLTELERGVPGPRVAARRGDRPAAETGPTTEAYRLVGMDQKLRPFVGQRVEITGEAEPEQVVNVRESSPPLDPANQRNVARAGPDPQISIVETTRIEISDVLVRSVTASGERCRPPR